MRTDKIQIDILKHLLKDPQVVSVEHADGDVLVSVDNCTMYRLVEQKLSVSLVGTRLTVVLKDLVDADLRSMTRLTPTDHYRNGGTVRKYLYDGQRDKPIYVSPERLKYFDEPTLYVRGRYDPYLIIVVAESPFGDEDNPEIVGYTLPCKVKDEETEE